MSTFYCPRCMVAVDPDQGPCPKCFGHDLTCWQCRQPVAQGSRACPTCTQAALAKVELPPVYSTAVARVPSAVKANEVVEVYRAGKYGVEAVVSIPPGDVAILNDLGKLVELLHAMAGRLNQFVGHTEHTRLLIRGMRNLATDVQEEVELRRGPQG